MLKKFTNLGDAWRLRGKPRRVATIWAACLLCVVVFVAVTDRAAEIGRDATLLQGWTLVPQMIALAGLMYLASQRSSMAFRALGVLIGLIVIEEAFHVLNPLAFWIGGGEWSFDIPTDFVLDVVDLVLLYGLIAVLGLGILAFSFWQGSEDERLVVRNVALFLLGGGFFAGPISAIAASFDTRTWILIEELGESIVFALLAAYAVGLVASIAPRDRPESVSDVVAAERP